MDSIPFIKTQKPRLSRCLSLKDKYIDAVPSPFAPFSTPLFTNREGGIEMKPHRRRRWYNKSQNGN